MSARHAKSERTRPHAPLPLREHRLRARVTLEEIMAQTKLSRRFLEAIEEGRYEELPGGVFAVNYIRQYAKVIGYDADLILEHYRRERPEEEEPEEQVRIQVPRWIRFFQSV